MENLSESIQTKGDKDFPYKLTLFTMCSVSEQGDPTFPLNTRENSEVEVLIGKTDS